MAEAPPEPSERGPLEQKILQVLRDADSPMRTPQLAKECQVSKKELNQVLYRMEKKQDVSQVARATWRLGAAGPGDLGSTELAQPSCAPRPQQDAAAIAENSGSQLSELQERIYRFLEANGPCKALRIAQALGMKTAKDVNPDLYKMKDFSLLSYDKNLSVWKLYGAEDSGRRNPPAPIIYQQNPVNMICQNGPNNRLVIANSEATQIGHGNVIMKQMIASGESGCTAPPHLPPAAPGDSSARGPLADVSRPLDIHMERSMLRRVQMGHSNEMTLLDVPSEGPTFGLSGSPPVSATASDSGASFNVHMPEPGPHPQGDAAQRVHIKSCFLEDATIGNSNRMTVSPGAAGGAGRGKGQQDPGQPEEDADPSCEAQRSRSNLGHPPAMSHSLLPSSRP